ncbi:hypothetical protein R3P38DRAFT_3255914 [Favolaschia claudopus]|uniref:NGN domain-containing protein n=1 Tax=Favolaschia claudopus TaxID=2862362 RepID=A0AAW0DE82_9AGAR
MKKYKALDFLDLAAVDDSDSEEEHELNDSTPSLRALCLTESNDLPVFTRAAYIDDDEDTSSNEVRPPRFVADSPFSIDPEQAARDIEERYRARYSGDSEARIGDTEIGHSIFEWAHTMERIEGSFKVPVWMIKVTRGRELDVVGTILKICSIHTGENVLSATAPPSAPGIVYIECDHEGIVRNLQRKVAFIRRDIPPRQVASTDFRSALVLRPDYDIEESAWVRIRRNNGYLGDLGWVQTRIEDTPWYVVYVVPRMEVREGESGGKIRAGDNDEEERSASEPQPETEQLRGGSVLPFGKKRKWASISQPLDWQPTFLVDHVSGKLDPSNVHESSSGATFHYGFLVLSLPQEDLTWHNVVPSFDEAQLWGSSPFFLAAEHTPGGFDNRDEPLVLQFAASVAKAVETTNTRGELQVGDQVRIIADDNISVGRVLDVGAGELVRVQQYDPDAPTTIEVDVPASQLALHHRVGDFVQVVIGRLTGMLGWITAVDWPQRQVDVMYHASVTSESLPENEEPQSKDREGDGMAVLDAEAGKVPGESTHGDASVDQPSSSLQRPPASMPPPPLRGLKPPHLVTAYEPDDSAYVLPWSHIRPRNETSAHRDFRILDAKTNKVSVPRASQDPYKHVEVKAFAKNIGVIFGSVTNTSLDGDFVWVKTEGRAVNTIEKVPVANVVERHTSLTLPDYRAAPPDEIRALRIQQESARAAGPPNTASTTEFPSESLPSAQEAWPEVLADQSPSSTLASSSSSTPAPPGPSTIEPGRWLLHPNLQGKYFDVIIHGATGPRSVDCNDKIGAIQSLSEIKRNIRGSAKVRFGVLLATDRFIPVANIFPLTTNEFEGAITREAAHCVLDVLNDSCSYFTKYILQPTDIILSNGGYVLHPDLTLPLTNIISGMDYFLDLASQHRGLQQLHSIGSKLSILTTPGMDSTPATQSQVVHNWVLLIDRILAAKHQLHALCFSNTSLRFLPKWDTQLASIASSLPQELRSRLPYDFIQRFNIQDTLPKKVTTRSESLHAPVTPHSSPADVSPALPAPGCPPSITADELAAQWAHLIKMPLDPSWTVKRGNKRCSLRTELLSIIVNGVDRMQTALTDIFRPSLLQPICFQVDPHGQLEQVLGGIDTLDTFAIAWDTLTERMRKASNTFQECQRKYQEEQDSQRTEGSNTPNTREDRTPSVSSIPASSAQCPASSGSLVDLGGQKCQQPSNIDEADRHTKGIQSIPSPSHAPPPSPAPPRVVDRVAVELGGRQMYQQHINAYAEARLTKNIQKPPSTSAPLLSPAPCSVLSERTVELGGRRDQQRVNPAIPIATHPSPPPFCVVNAGTSTAKLVGRSLDQQLDHARLGQRTNKPAVEKLCGDETLAAPLLPHGELGKRPALGDSTPHQSPTPLVIDSGSIGSGDTPSIVEFGGLQGTAQMVNLQEALARRP